MKSLILALCILAVPFVAAANAPKKIAVLAFDEMDAEAKENALGRLVSEKLTTAAVRSGVFQVVERRLIEKILTEMEFGAKGASYSSVAQKVGELAGADAVLSGSVSVWRGKASIDARLVNVADGAILAAEEAFTGLDPEAVSQASAKAFSRMAAVIYPQSARGVESPPPGPSSEYQVQHKPAEDPRLTFSPPPAPTPVQGAVPGRFPEGSTRVLTPGELMGRSPADLRLMRNEIYARRGHTFTTPEMRDHFAKQPWYRAEVPDATNRLSEIEKNNVMLIRRFEK